MATNVNRTELAGTLGNDPEARSSAAGTLIVTASIAVHSSYKQGEEWKERTDWFRLVVLSVRGVTYGTVALRAPATSPPSESAPRL